MKIKKGLEKEFKEMEAKNQDGFGKGILDFTKRWVKLMEEHKGELTAEDVKKYCDKADSEGITGAMFGIAKGVIKKYVENGEKWINMYDGKQEKDYQEWKKNFIR